MYRIVKEEYMSKKRPCYRVEYWRESFLGVLFGGKWSPLIDANGRVVRYHDMESAYNEIKVLGMINGRLETVVWQQEPDNNLDI